MIGPLTIMERYQKVQKYFKTKRQRKFGKKFVYEARQKVAEKRLRIKGRFVTRPQAYEMLSLDLETTYTTEQLQEMLEKHF